MAPYLLKRGDIIMSSTGPIRAEAYSEGAYTVTDMDVTDDGNVVETPSRRLLLKADVLAAIHDDTGRSYSTIYWMGD